MEVVLIILEVIKDLQRHRDNAEVSPDMPHDCAGTVLTFWIAVYFFSAMA